MRPSLASLSTYSSNERIRMSWLNMLVSSCGSAAAQSSSVAAI